MSKIFGCPGIALAIYFTAQPHRRKKVAALLIPAVITAILCGITEPLEFTFLFIAPLLFAVHACLAGTLAAVMYSFGVVGNFGGGILDTALFQNWVPLFKNHYMTYIIQIIIGLIFTGIWFLVFRFLIIKLNLKTPGRGEEDEDKLYSKADYKARQNEDVRDVQATAFLKGLGGKDNIVDVTNCATRLRVNVKDDRLVQATKVFMAAGAHGLVHNKNSIQVIVGLSVPQVRERFEELLKSDFSGCDASNYGEFSLKAFATGKVIPIEEVPDEAFSTRTLGDGIAIMPTNGLISAPADGQVVMTMETGHAIGLKLDTGIELLIHIGIDTVNMKGEGFKLLVESGDMVKAGEDLILFDIDKISKEGLNPVAIMVATNTEQYVLAFNQAEKAEGGITEIATY